MKITSERLFAFLTLLSASLNIGNGFVIDSSKVGTSSRLGLSQNADIQLSIEEATKLLADWDRHYSTETPGESEFDVGSTLPQLPGAVKLLNNKAAEERNADPTTGR
jgi:hypothetical protein